MRWKTPVPGPVDISKQDKCSENFSPKPMPPVPESSSARAFTVGRIVLLRQSRERHVEVFVFKLNPKAIGSKDCFKAPSFAETRYVREIVSVKVLYCVYNYTVFLRPTR